MSMGRIMSRFRHFCSYQLGGVVSLVGISVHGKDYKS
jgi:hypothetical protein